MDLLLSAPDASSGLSLCQHANAGEHKASLPTSLGASWAGSPGPHPQGPPRPHGQPGLLSGHGDLLRQGVKSMARKLAGRPVVPGRRSPSWVPGRHVVRSELPDTRGTPPGLGPGVLDVPAQRDVSLLTQKGAVSVTPVPCLLGTGSACPSPRPPGPLPLWPVPGRGR